MYVLDLIIDTLLITMFCLVSSFVLMFGKRHTWIKLDYTFFVVAIILIGVFK